jgi:lysophospholipase L1-like esterase
MMRFIKYGMFFLFSGILIVVTSEIGLRFFAKLRTYSEQNFGIYQNPYNTDNDKYYYLWNPCTVFTNAQPEFSYDYYINSIGLADKREFNEIETDNTIIFLGDSFTFGVGSPQDSSAPKLLENNLMMNAIDFNVVNAGVAGSDPFYQNKIIDDIFIPAGFKHYILAINISDLYDFIFRGGNERFNELEKNINPQKAPWYEPIYKNSLVFRGVVHFVFKIDYSLLTRKKTISEKHNAVKKYVELLSKLNDKIKSIGGTLIVVLHPYPTQFSKLKVKNNNEVLNYKYLNNIHQLLLERNVNSYNLEPNFLKVLSHENYSEYSWEIDGHFNSKGYQLYADILFEELFKSDK